MSYPSERSFRKTTELLTRKGLLERQDPEDRGEWVSVLSSKGRSAINHNLNPTDLWSEPWDGKWRLFSFDLPRSAHAARQALRKWLESHRFGRLQGSVWITPRDLGEWTSQLEKINVDSMNTVYACGSLGNEGDPTYYISRAWNFDQINRDYEEYLNFIKTGHSFRSSVFKDWFTKESSLWKKAFEKDPFLPKDLWTGDFQSGYLGPKALQERIRKYKAWKLELLD